MIVSVNGLIACAPPVDRKKRTGLDLGRAADSDLVGLSVLAEVWIDKIGRLHEGDTVYVTSETVASPRFARVYKIPGTEVQCVLMAASEVLMVRRQQQAVSLPAANSR